MPPSIVLLLGAGATVADVATRPMTARPPLDRGFFHGARRTLPASFTVVRSYMASTYDRDILHRDNNSLEQVISQLYTDIFNPSLQSQATSAFTSLLGLFTRRLADTTNTIDATNRRWFYRILVAYLRQGAIPGDITIITFNQDIQIEKNLALLSQVPRWERYADTLFNFPWCYGLKPANVTAPATVPVFDEQPLVPHAMRVLKLHGSLNWYSRHISQRPSPQALFNPMRRLSITRRRRILASMTMKGGKRVTYTFPVIVPPVSHKSAVLHDELKAVWRQAETALREAEEVLIFGYSCPPLDFESSSMLRRSLRAHRPRIVVVDPAAAAASRYIDLVEPKGLSYYPSASEYLTP